MKAKIFLSCGQSKNSDEIEIAKQVAQKIRDEGFECYIAVTEQSLVGLRENIFDQLKSSDYFVFIDFKREQIVLSGTEQFHRGSLFSHQELAIGSFLEIPAIILQEKGIKPLDGMLGAIQGNATEFTDRKLLPNVVADLLRSKLRTGEWQIQSRNQLTLEIVPLGSDAQHRILGPLRHFHISVSNRSRHKAGVDCFAYLDSVVNLDTGVRTPMETIEFKWAGSTLPSVRIGPAASRKFDAFWFKRQSPIEIGFNVFTDSTEYYPGTYIKNPGKFLLTYSVASQSFVQASKDFVLEFGTTIESISFTEAT